MRNILFVDDEFFMRGIFSEWLTRTGDDFCILTAENGRKAVELLESHPVDVLITDLKMPEMDGFELLAYAARRHPSMPAIAITAFADEEAYEKLAALGVSHCIMKPFEFKDLIEKIYVCCGAARRQSVA